MNKPVLIALASFLMTALLCSSCKKKDGTTAEMLMGTWKVAEQGIDNNGNGAWDKDEHWPSEEGLEAVVVYQSDGKGYSYAPLTAPNKVEFQWELVDGGSQIRLVSDFAGVVDTTYSTILAVSSSDLSCKSIVGDNTSFTSYVKQ